VERGPVVGPQRGGGTAAATGVSSWVPKEEKLSWRTGTLPASCSSLLLPLSLSPSLSLSLSLSHPLSPLLSLPLSPVSCTSYRRRNGELFGRARARKTEGGAREFVRPSGRFLVSFIYRFVGENRRNAAEIYLRHDFIYEFFAFDSTRERAVTRALSLLFLAFRFI